MTVNSNFNIYDKITERRSKMSKWCIVYASNDRSWSPNIRATNFAVSILFSDNDPDDVKKIYEEDDDFYYKLLTSHCRLNKNSLIFKHIITSKDDLYNLPKEYIVNALKKVIYFYDGKWICKDYVFPNYNLFNFLDQPKLTVIHLEQSHNRNTINDWLTSKLYGYYFTDDIEHITYNLKMPGSEEYDIGMLANTLVSSESNEHRFAIILPKKRGIDIEMMESIISVTSIYIKCFYISTVRNNLYDVKREGSTFYISLMDGEI